GIVTATLKAMRIPGVALIAVAAAMWGTDPILRKPIASIDATTIVFGEHVFLVVLTLPLLLPALRAVWRAGPRYLVAVLGAGALLGERPRPRFGLFLVGGLAGLWLVNQTHPLDPSAHGLLAVGEALAAAVLWAMGTVLGRYLGRELEFEHILALRFCFGLV